MVLQSVSIVSQSPCFDSDFVETYHFVEYCVANSTEFQPALPKQDLIMQLDRRILWVLCLVALLVILWLAFDHILFPTLPVPSGVPPIAK